MAVAVVAVVVVVVVGRRWFLFGRISLVGRPLVEPSDQWRSLVAVNGDSAGTPRQRNNATLEKSSLRSNTNAQAQPWFAWPTLV